MIFGVNDYLDGASENKPLVEEYYFLEYGWMRVNREGTHFLGEYFAYQFLIAMNFPAPQTRLFNDGYSTYIDSKLLSHFSDPISIEGLATPQAEASLKPLRLDPSFYVAPIAELVMQDADNVQYLVVKQNDRLYRVAKDRELVQAKPLSSLNMWEQIKQYDRLQYFHASTLEQQLAVVNRLEHVCSEKSGILHNIFYNARVNLSPDLCTQYRDELYASWLDNAQKIIAAYKAKYSDLYGTFEKREQVRIQLVDIILKNITLPTYVCPVQFKKELIDDLRGNLYFKEASLIDAAVLNDNTQINRILHSEQRRLGEHELRKQFDLIILEEMQADEQHIFPAPCKYHLTHFYKNQANNFISQQQNINLDNVDALAKQFSETIKSIHCKETLIKQLPAGSHYFDSDLSNLTQVSHKNLILSDIKRNKERLINNLEGRMAPDDFRANFVPEAREELCYYDLQRFYKGLSKSTQELISKYHLTDTVAQELSQEVDKIRAELKALGKPFKKAVISKFAMNGVFANPVVDRILPYFEAISFKKAPFTDLLTFRYIINENNLLDSQALSLYSRLIKDYFKQIFKHYNNDEKEMPAITVQDNTLKIQFADKDSMIRTLKAVSEDTYKLSNPFKEIRKKSFVGTLQKP